MGSREDRTWEEFVAVVAECARCPAASVIPGAALDADLGMDSLGIAELVVALAVDFEAITLVDQLETRDFSTETVGSLFHELSRDRQAKAE